MDRQLQHLMIAVVQIVLIECVFMQEMATQGVQFDSLSYRILIYTASQTQAWPRALQLYR